MASLAAVAMLASGLVVVDSVARVVPVRAATASGAGEYVPLTPAQIVDTRSGLGMTGPVTATGGTGGVYSFQVTGRGGVPTSGVSAVSVDVQAINATVLTWMTVWAQGTPRPASAQLSPQAGSTVVNTVITKLGSSGMASLQVGSGSMQVTVSVQGYFTNNQTTTTGGTFVALTPTRIVDTRIGQGIPAKLGANSTTTLSVTGVGGVPAANVSAVVLNLTTVNAAAAGAIVVWPSGTKPAVTTMNFPTSTAFASMTQVGVSSTGTVQIYTTVATDLVVDVEGYYNAPSQDAASFFTPVTPARIYDTRNPPINTGGLVAPLAAGATASVPIRGVKDSSGAVIVPAQSTISAVAISVTVTHVTGNGYIAVFPDGVANPPLADVLDYTTSSQLSNSAIAKVGADGRIAVYSKAGLDLIVDVEGYYQSTPPPAPPAPGVSSSTFPADGWASSGGSGSVSLSTTAGTSPAVRQYRYALDDPTMSAATAVTVGSDNATATPTLTPGDGWHTLYAQAVNTAGNISATTSYTFGVGIGITSPANGARVTRYARLDARASTSYGSVTWNYRRASTDLWTTVPASDVTNNGATVSGWPVATSVSGASAVAPELVWNAANTLGGDTTVLLQACFTPTGGGSATCTADTADPTLALDHLDAGNTDASSDLPVGTLDLLTGNLATATTDVQIGTGTSDLSVARTFNSLDASHNADAGSGVPSVFGPGWTTGLPVESAGSSWTGLSDRGTTVVVNDVDGAPTTFALQPDGSYLATGDDRDSGLTLTAANLGADGPGLFTVTDLDGNATSFVPAAPLVAPPTQFVPNGYDVATISQPGSGQTTAETYTVTGTPRQVLAPSPAGVDCSLSWGAGCRALTFAYTTANLLAAVTYRTTDSAGSELDVDVACYSYDSNGRLAQAWDPRDGTAGSGSHPIVCGSPVRATSYGYDGNGRLATITPPGLAAWNLSYDTSGRLSTLTRTHNGGGSETTTVVYNVPTAADGSNPSYRPSMTAADVATWGQAEAPLTATAVFSPGHTSSATNVAGADVSYLNAEGRVTNTADYAGSGAAGWHITSTDYDSHGNITRLLSAANREEALNSTGDDLLKLPTDTAAAADALSTVNLYSYDPAGVGDLTDTFGPAHLAQLSTSAAGTLTPIRTHTHNTYDNGSELGHPAGGLLHLITQTSESASQSLLPVATNEVDTRTTTDDYALSSTDATGWTFRAPMRVTIDPGSGHLNIATVTRYDPATGAVIETRQPASTGTDAGTTQTVYYTAGTNSLDAACGNQPAWANLACETRPAAQPGLAGLPGLVTRKVSGYDYLNRPTTVVETVTDASGTQQTRTTSTTYTSSGYGTDTATTSVTGGAPADTAVPVTSFSYDTSTGLLRTTSAAATVTQPATSSTTGYDDFGRVTSYSDNDQATGTQANTTATSYDTAGRIATVTDAHGSTTYTYNGNGETRDLPTTVTVSALGAITGSYNPDGTLTSETFANGPTQTLSVDETNTPSVLTAVTSGRAWITEQQAHSVHGQIVADDLNGDLSYGGHLGYSYDAAGRLTQTTDNLTGTCITRTYTFDADSNRLNTTSHNPTNGACSASGAVASTANHSYDTADRLQPAGTDTGISYDAFGRITTLPTTDTPTGATASVGYYANDRVWSQASGSITNSWTLDANSRLNAWIAGGVTHTNHYDDASSDSPDWTAESTDGNTWTRYLTGLDGNLAATINQAGTLTWQIDNLHGDSVATATSGSADPAAYFLTDEYGDHEGTGASTSRYGWLGAKQRSHDTPAQLTLMGVRLYNPVLGRFQQTDSISRGSANDYDYSAQDPINNTDLDGLSYQGDGPCSTAFMCYGHGSYRDWLETNQYLRDQRRSKSPGPGEDTERSKAVCKAIGFIGGNFISIKTRELGPRNLNNDRRFIEHTSKHIATGGGLEISCLELFGRTIPAHTFHAVNLLTHRAQWG